VRHKSLRRSDFWGPETKSQPLISFSLRLWTRLNLYTHIDLQAYIICILETFTALIIELRTWILFTECTESNCLRSLPICHQSDNSQGVILLTSDSWHPYVQQDHIPVFSTKCNRIILTSLFLIRNWWIVNIEGVNIHKNLKYTNSWVPSFQHSFTDLSSRVKTFERFLVSSPTWALPLAMLLDANCN
jgi:hypothetical protein